MKSQKKLLWIRGCDRKSFLSVWFDALIFNSKYWKYNMNHMCLAWCTVDVRRDKKRYTSLKSGIKYLLINFSSFISWLFIYILKFSFLHKLICISFKLFNMQWRLCSKETAMYDANILKKMSCYDIYDICIYYINRLFIIRKSPI